MGEVTESSAVIEDIRLDVLKALKLRSNSLPPVVPLVQSPSYGPEGGEAENTV